ncbi:MAG: acetyl-CoA carboxylase biotin carboxyl carrier protein [Hyphomonadaceae bacterium]
MSEKKPASGIDPELVKELAGILRDSGLTEIEVEQGEMKLRLSRAAAVAAPQAFMAAAQPLAQPQIVQTAAASAPADAPQDLRQHPGAVTSPMVGTAYLSPDPDSPVFIKEGDTVTLGQTLLIVEAMKTFNPIPAPRAGRVTRILVADRQPVEFGEALVIIE